MSDRATPGPAHSSLSVDSSAPVRKFSVGSKPAAAPLTPEQLQCQTVPPDAAMLELIPRGDVFAAHKLVSTRAHTQAMFRKWIALEGPS
jgi:hypothetical protein